MTQTASRRSSTRGKYQTKQKRRRSGSSPSPLTIFIAVFAIVGLLGVGIYLWIDTQNGTIAENVTLAGTNIGGMTQAAAIRTVNDAIADTYSKKSMTVTVLDSEIQISPAVSQVSLDTAAAVRAAYRHGQPNEQFDCTPYLNVNESGIKAALQELGDKYSSTLSQTTYEVTGTAPNQVLVVKLGVPEYALDMNQLYDQVITTYSNNSFSVKGECGLITPEALDLQKILDVYYVAPVDATLNYETYSVVEGIDGYGFDIQAAEEKLSAAGYGNTVEIPFTAIPPQVTTEALKNSFFKDTLATYTAKHDSEENRDTNLRLACQAISGKVLYPGEVFSYNKALGERTEARGYKPGPSFVGGKTVDTIGGGICQVSSALYYCAMMSDMSIHTRENHGYAVNYVPLGMDAAVSWGSLDFCFVNTSSMPIRIEAYSSGGNVTVSILGTDDKTYYVEMLYEVLATHSYETVYQTLPADNPEGYENGSYITEPHTGYSVKTYRCKYDKETKNLISQETEAASYYEKCDAVICIIDGSDEKPQQGIGNGGVTEADGALP